MMLQGVFNEENIEAILRISDHNLEAEMGRYKTKSFAIEIIILNDIKEKYQYQFSKVPYGR